MEENNVRIVIVEDDKIIREGYRFLIGEKQGYHVVNTYSTAEQAIRKLTEDLPDLVMLDVGLPGMSGIEAIPKIKDVSADIRILVCTVHDTEEIIFKALTNGANGYLTKNSSAIKIMESIREIMQGGASMSANVAQLVIRSFRRNSHSPLSKRETQILEEIAKGKNRRIIADELFIDNETVKSHIKNIYAKLNVHSKADAIRTAKENKLI